MTAPSIESLQLYVSIETGVGLNDLLSRRQETRVVRARHAAMWLARREGVYAIPKIAWEFGDLDRTTVRNAVRTIDRHMAADPAFAAWMTDLATAVDRHAREREYLLRQTAPVAHAA